MIDRATSVDIPRVLHSQPQIVVCSERHRCLNVPDRPSIHPNDGHTSLSARHPEGGVQVARIDRAIRERERLETGRLHGARLVRSPVAVVPVGDHGGALRAVSGHIAGFCGRLRMDERLGDLGCELGEVAVAWPARVSE